MSVAFHADGGINRYAPVAPCSAAPSAVRSSSEAIATSAPLAFQTSPLAASRTMTRTGCLAASSALAAAEPVFPVTPAMTYMAAPLFDGHQSGSAAVMSQIDCLHD